MGLDTPAESGPGVMRDALLMERVDGDGVGGGGRGTTGAGGAFGGPRSMAAAILSRLEEMRPRGRSNIATRPRRAFITLPHPGQLPLACARQIRRHNSNPPWNKRACS